MELEILNFDFTICKLDSTKNICLNDEIYFVGRTDKEISLVCLTKKTPENISAREDDRKCFRIAGVLDFSLTGILAKISVLLAENQIGIFAVSTFNTDYIFVKSENFNRTIEVLNAAGYAIKNNF